MWSRSHTTESLLSREGTLALGICVQPSVEENPAWPQIHRHIRRSPWTPSSTVTCQTENLWQLRPLGTSNQSQRIKPALLGSCNGHARRAFQASPQRALLSSLSIRGTLEHSKRTSPVSQKDTCCLEQLSCCSLGKPPRRLEANRPFVGHHGSNLQRRQTSDSRPFSGVGALESATAHWNCHVLALNLTVACVFRLPSSHSTPASPPYWEFWSQNAAFFVSTKRRRDL